MESAPDITARLDRIESTIGTLARDYKRDTKQAQQHRKRSARKLEQVTEAAAWSALTTDLIFYGVCLGAVAIVDGYALIMDNVPGWAKSYFQFTRTVEEQPYHMAQQPQVSAHVAAQALTWKGVNFKPGQTARCADWVRRVLSEAGVNVGVAKGSAGPLMADSFHGAELGELILDSGQLRPGDIVMLADTYNGPGRSPIRGRGRITHVGIVTSCDGGGCMMADRPTSSRPVQHRPVSTFKFHSALRPAEYGKALPPSSTAPHPSGNGLPVGFTVGQADETVSAIFNGAINLGVTDPYQISYILATAQHESASFRTLHEFGTGGYCGSARKYDGWAGVGLVQLTWKGNFDRARKRLGFDDMGAEQFCKEVAARPDVAVTILIEGMMGGWFTGVGLPRYVGGGRRDYVNARRVVNGNDQDARIAGIARGYEPRVKAWLREHGH